MTTRDLLRMTATTRELQAFEAVYARMVGLHGRDAAERIALCAINATVEQLRSRPQMWA